MTKYCFALLLLFGLYFTVAAQKNKRDSLLLVLKSQKQDTNKVKTLYSLSYLYDVNKPDTSIHLAIEALDLSKRLRYQRGIISSFGRLGMSCSIAGLYPKALSFYLQGLKMAESNRDSLSMASIYNGIGLLHKEQGNYREALNYLQIGNTLAKRLDLLANTCDTYVQMQIADSARIFGQQAINMAYEYKNPRQLGWTSFELAYAHLIAGEFPLALNYFRMSIPLSLGVDDYFGLCKEYRGIAQVFAQTGQRDSSLHYGRLALSLATQNNLPHEALRASNLLASFYRNEHNSDSALAYMDVSKNINDSLFSQQNQAHLQSLTLDEKLRQIEKEESERKDREQRNHNLQNVAIAIGVVTLLIGFLVLSHSVIANQKLIRFLGVISLLIVFEFLNLLLHPWLGAVTHHSPVLMLLAMVCVAALLVPIHHRLEHWITHKLVEKNNRKRLAAAKHIIQQLEGGIAPSTVHPTTSTRRRLN